MSQVKTVVKYKQRNSQTEFDSVVGRRSSLSDRIRLRRLERERNNRIEPDNNLEGNNIADNNPLYYRNDNTINETAEVIPGTSTLIELVSDTDLKGAGESRDETIEEEGMTEEMITDINVNDSNTNISIVERDTISSGSNFRPNPIELIDPIRSMNTINPSNPVGINTVELNGYANPISPVHDSTHQDVLESLTESNNHIDRATTLFELAQTQNRWILFGLGAGLVGIAGLSYWIGYRAGSSALTPENIPTRATTIDPRRRSFKIIWNLIIDQLKR